ncbi:hypothetical protein Tco_0893312 [Tanacetum coccineum]|uniref:Uncharacterized protein n=1 Tax=Tanacetum coccineum TaxID=301880 RepID=A0ABQ5C8Z0_9ASTR
MGSRLSKLELSQTALITDISAIREDTSDINSMMVEMFNAFKGQPFPTLTSSVTPTLALTHIPANVERENEANTTTEDPPSHTKGEIDAMDTENKQEQPEEPKQSTDANIEFISSSTPHPSKTSVTQAQPITTIASSVPQREGKGIATEAQSEPQRKLVKASSIIRPGPDAQILVPYTINGKLFNLTAEYIQAHMDKEDQIKRAKEEDKLIHPKVVITTQAGEKFKKAQDAEHDVLKRKHTEKARRSLELMKSKYENYIGTDGGTFDIHNPFAFGNFGISELDELREIIPKKKNAIVKDLMNSLSRRYERIKKTLKELRIKSALPAPIPKQDSTKPSGKKRKHMELEPEIKSPGLEYN